MSLPIVIVASGGIPVTEVASGFGAPVSVANNGFGLAVTVVSSGGIPVVGSQQIKLSAATVLDNATIGAVIGALSVQNGSGTYTYTLTSNPGGLFAIATANLTVGAALSVGSDAITIHADNGAGSVLNAPFLITVTSSAAFALKADLSAASNEPWVFW
jgi:hypothetical protein